MKQRLHYATGALSVAALLALGACSDQIHLGSEWFADHETGNLSQWAEGGTSAGGQILSSDAQLTVVTSPSPTHGGRFAVRSAIFAANKTSYARLFRSGVLPNDAYFRVWMYIPQRYTIGLYWNVFEFQGRTNPTEPNTYQYLWSLDLEQA